ncbi:MAG: pirin family protein [Hymenobacteraceae bacterium]|nr:pirin family protein [Hymenobacteraceae bacterium]
MLQLIPADARFFADLGGLQAHFLFSFAHYYDPANVEFGPLRTFNDVTLAPRTALPLHPHTEVEIVTIVLDGALTYSDAAGNHRDVRAGHVLRLTAGTGTQHAEANRGNGPAHALELWFRPGQAGLLPSQEQKMIAFQPRAAAWTALVSGRGDGGEAAVFLNCDATVWWASLAPGVSLPYVADDDRQLLVYAVAGTATINGESLPAGAHFRCSPAARLTIATAAGASVVLVDVAQ